MYELMHGFLSVAFFDFNRKNCHPDATSQTDGSSEAQCTLRYAFGVFHSPTASA